MSSTVYIYALVDPRTYLMRYVGQTTNPKVRLTQHVNTPSGRVRSWINSLHRSLCEPVMQILEEATEEHGAEREQFWIYTLLAKGVPLLNTFMSEVVEHRSRASYNDTVLEGRGIAERIRDLRQAAGLGQRELGRLLGQSNTVIGTIENDRHIPGALTLIGLSRVFNVSIDYLVTGREWQSSLEKAAE